MSPQDDVVLVRVATSVADGTSVDWTAEIDSHPSLRPQLRRLRVLEALSLLHASSAFDPLIGRSFAHYRFRKEALALSRLNHPNIEIVHDFDTEDGMDFLVMEHITGQTLAEKLTGRAVPEKEAAALGAQIASALVEAHERRILHRDLKPANIMVTPKGQTKVLDFGLATLLRPREDLTPIEAGGQASTVAGTLPYMAPEQVRGGSVDVRSDIYAAGAVRFEMSTGRRPFPEESAPRLKVAILNEAPPSPKAINGSISSAMDRIILKALHKDPDRRHQSAGELLGELEHLCVTLLPVSHEQPRTRTLWWVLAWTGVLVVLASGLAGLNVGGVGDRLLGRAAPRPIESLAVLPLVNLSHDPEQEYFADGMTEALITGLSKASALRVISRTSVMRYKETGKTLPEIARELNVDVVIEGTVLRSGDRVRITAQLVEGATDRQLWAQSYERDLRDVLALQDEVARAIAGQVKATLSPPGKQGLSAEHPVNTTAYQAYLKGRHFQDRRTTDSIRKSVKYFEEAIEGSPGDAPAYAALADSYVLLASYGAAPPVEAYRKVKVLAMKAIELDENLADAHVALAGVLDGEWDFLSADREFRRAIELNPSHAHARHWYAAMLNNLGRFKEAHAEYGRAAELDPLSSAIAGAAGDPYYMDGQYDLAIREYLKALEIDPNHAVLHGDLGKAYLFRGMIQEATSEIRKAIDLSGGQAAHVATLALVHAVAGRRAEALTMLESLTRPDSQGDDVPLEVAAVYAALGDKDRAFEWLERAYDQRDYWLTGIRVDPRFDALRADPRLDNLVRRIGLPPT